MKRIIYKASVLLIQRSLTHASYLLHRFAKTNHNQNLWVVGVAEIAGMSHQIASSLPNSISVLFYPHRFYNFHYTYNIGFRASKFKTLLIGPWLLGKLTNQSNGFIYVGGQGFLFSNYDNRYWEFNFIKKRKLKLVLYFTGSDIRSIELMKEEFSRSNEENFANFVGWTNPFLLTQEHEHTVKEIAKVADKFGDLIFNAEYDQKSHLKSATEPFKYFYNMLDLDFMETKFESENLASIKIAHAPSSPLIKGTQVIRTILRMLENDGFKFEYFEITDVSNSELISKIRECHIVVNELYGFMPGVLAIEAMANSCVVLTRADSSYEKRLPVGSNDAWIVTPSYRLYDNLKACLENPNELGTQARKGYNWVKKYASAEANGPLLIEKLNGLQIR